MIIVGNKSGRLGNRLKLFAHLIANSNQMGTYEILNPSFGDYSQYFESTVGKSTPIYPPDSEPPFFASMIRNRYILRFLSETAAYTNNYQSILNVIDIRKTHDSCGSLYDLQCDEYKFGVKEKLIVILLGYAFRDPISVINYADQIRAYFRLTTRYQKRVDRLVEEARNSEVLIGVHIRQTDYQTYRNGVLYFPTLKYINVMRHICDLFPGSNVSFLVCSDSPQDPAAFGDISVSISTEEAIIDMYALSQCDYILAVSSSFSGWSSFYGNKPLWHIENESLPGSLSDFSIHYL